MTTTAIEVRPIAGSLGAEVHGVQLGDGVDGALLTQIRQALLDQLVLFFPRQALSPEDHKAFGALFGTLDLHQELPALEGHPEIVVLDSTESKLADMWHADVTFEARPPLGSLLHMQIAPPFGGDTEWANMYLAYESLSERMQRYLDGLTVVHESWWSAEVRAEHPLVRTHPETGRKSLFLSSPPRMKQILGVPQDESDALLRFLHEHATQADFTCRWRWSEGDLAFWDNRCTRHRAIGDIQGQHRRLHRVVIEGDVPV